MWETLKQWLIVPSQSAWNSNIFFFCFSWSRSGRSSLGLPGRGVCSAGEHRTLQQPPLWQEPQQPGLSACGQLLAECLGTAGGPAWGLPNELWPVAGAGGLLQTYFMGGAAPVRISERSHLHTCIMMNLWWVFLWWITDQCMVHVLCTRVSDKF